MTVRKVNGNFSASHRATGSATRTQDHPTTLDLLDVAAHDRRTLRWKFELAHPSLSKPVLIAAYTSKSGVYFWHQQLGPDWLDCVLPPDTEAQIRTHIRSRSVGARLVTVLADEGAGRVDSGTEALYAI